MPVDSGQPQAANRAARRHLQQVVFDIEDLFYTRRLLEETDPVARAAADGALLRALQTLRAAEDTAPSAAQGSVHLDAAA